MLSLAHWLLNATNTMKVIGDPGECMKLFLCGTRATDGTAFVLETVIKDFIPERA